MNSIAQATETLQQRIRRAADSGTRLHIAGAGSKAFYTRQKEDGELLDLSGLSGVLSYEPSELVVTVGAATPLLELEALLLGHGQYLPFEPPHFGISGGASATVGGMLASGLCGPARASAGSVRDYVLGLKLINGQGQLLTFGGQVMKNVAGYDVSRLMAGALGTLGVVTEVSLKVLPVPPAEATLQFALDQSAALECLHRWGGQPLPLNASCWVHDDTQDPARGMLFLRLRGAVAAVEAACDRLLASQPGVRMDNAVSAPDWARCRDLALPFFQPPADPTAVLWRLSVPQTAPVLDLPGAVLVEWHGAQRWVWAAESAAAAVKTAATRAGGSAQAFWCPGRAAGAGAARPQQLASADPAQALIYQRLKAAFDPQHIFNQSLFPHAN